MDHSFWSFSFRLVGYLLFGSVALIFLTEILQSLRNAWRRGRMTDEEKEQLEAWKRGDFSMRRGDSELRHRHQQKLPPKGRLTEINAPDRDPYSP